MLGWVDPKPIEAVPVLIDALENGPNDIDTGDGIMPYRSTLVMALGQIGDPRAIRPLIEKLKLTVAYTPSPGNTMPILEWDLPIGVAHEAIVKALAMFGPEAKDATPILEASLAAGRDYDRKLAKLVEQTLTKISDPMAAAAVAPPRLR